MTLTDKLRAAWPMGEVFTSAHIKATLGLNQSQVSGILSHLMNTGEITIDRENWPPEYTRVKDKAPRRKSPGRPRAEHTAPPPDRGSMQQQALERARLFLESNGYQVLAP